MNCLKEATSYEKLNAYKSFVLDWIPQMSETLEFDQDNPHHNRNLWEHSLDVVVNMPKGIDDNMLYLAALLHDIGKIKTKTKGKKAEASYSHYYGHAAYSKQIVCDEIIPTLQKKGYSIGLFDYRRLVFYIENHEENINEKTVERLYDELGCESLCNLLRLQIADAKSHVQSDEIRYKIAGCQKLIDKYTSKKEGSYH